MTTLNQKIQEFKGKLGEFEAARSAIEAKKVELEAKLVELNDQLQEIQSSNLLDISAESLLKDQVIKKEISETEDLLVAVKGREGKLAFPEELNELGRAVYADAITEAAQDYADKLPALLEEIGEAKRLYLSKLVEYHALKTGVNQKITEVAHEIHREPNPLDFPNVKEIAWHYFDHPAADGSKYTVAQWEVNDAIMYGKIK